MKIAFAIALCASAGLASAGITVSEASITDFGLSSFTPSGDGYTQVAGLGGAGGFAIATSGAVNDTFDGLAQNIGADLFSTSPHDGIAETDTFAGAGSSGLIQFGLISPADMAPAGFSVGGLPADTAGYFVGANAGGDSVDSVPAILVSLATIEILDTAGGSLGVSDITGFANFTAGAGGTWDGSMGVSFGAGSAGLGIGGYIVTIEGTLVPTPASAALLGLGGLVAVRRRR